MMNFFYLIPPVVAQGIIVCCVLLFLWYYTTSKARLLLATILMLCCVVTYTKKEKRAVVVSESTIYAGPHERYPVIGHAHAHDVLMVEDKIDAWYKIRLSRADSATMRGWMMETALETV